MRHTFAATAWAVILMTSASVAGAANRFPNVSCPDSVTISQIQDASLACHPAPLDTVSGVAGIITGFDAVPVAFSFYLQSTSGGTFTGIDIFTGATDYNAAPYNLEVGDSVVIELGTIQEFPSVNGTTEIEGPDVVQSTDDIIIRKINSGNALPPFATGTTATFAAIPTALDPIVADQEQYEGMLVKVTNTPLVVRRIDAGLGDGLPFGAFLCTAKTGAQDSVMVDMQTLQGAGGAVPTVGTQIDFLQGILNEGSVDGRVRYRIQTRNANDFGGGIVPVRQESLGRVKARYR